jgi:hypothetical protein
MREDRIRAPSHKLLSTKRCHRNGWSRGTTDHRSFGGFDELEMGDDALGRSMSAWRCALCESALLRIELECVSNISPGILYGKQS